MNINESIQEKIVSRWVVRGNIVPRALPKTTFDALVKLDKLRCLLNSAFRTNLSPYRRDDWSVPNLKGFCDGILDRDTPWHHWRSLLLKNHACRRTRVAVAASLFLFRKVLPLELTKDEQMKKILSYVDKMSSPSPPLDPEFATFCRSEVRRLFKAGWDDKWIERRDAFTLPTSSCIEKKRSEGGSRNLDREALREAYKLFTEGRITDLGRDTVPMMVPSGGKFRLVTQFSCLRSFLQPLHSIIYGHLSRYRWLLRGDVDQKSVDHFRQVEGEVFVSGDYENASDNLNINLSELMLSEIRRGSTHVPDSVWLSAMDSLQSRFPDGRLQRSGQMMGSLLCFPLLCLANYLTFRYAIRRPVPLLINGDDIVFRCRTNEKDKWIKSVINSGLVLSVGKTMIHKSVFSINSAYFISSKSSGVSSAPFVRSKCLFGGAEDAGEVAGRLAGCCVAKGRVRDIFQSFLLREMSGSVHCTQRSLRRGLGARLSNAAIRWAKLDEREGFYLSLPFEPAVPQRKKAWMHNSIPEGYIRCPGVEDHEDFRNDMIETTWSRAPIYKGNFTDDYWDYVRERTFRYSPFSARRFWRLAGGKGYYPLPSLVCDRPEKCGWLKQREGDVAFVSAGFE